MHSKKKIIKVEKTSLLLLLLDPFYIRMDCRQEITGQQVLKEGFASNPSSVAMTTQKRFAIR
jgi:hypothetical protein